MYKHYSVSHNVGLSYVDGLFRRFVELYDSIPVRTALSGHFWCLAVFFRIIELEGRLTRCAVAVRVGKIGCRHGLGNMIAAQKSSS